MGSSWQRAVRWRGESSATAGRSSWREKNWGECEEKQRRGGEKRCERKRMGPGQNSIGKEGKGGGRNQEACAGANRQGGFQKPAVACDWGVYRCDTRAAHVCFWGVGARRSGTARGQADDAKQRQREREREAARRRPRSNGREGESERERRERGERERERERGREGGSDRMGGAAAGRPQWRQKAAARRRRRRRGPLWLRAPSKLPKEGGQREKGDRGGGERERGGGGRHVPDGAASLAPKAASDGAQGGGRAASQTKLAGWLGQTKRPRGGRAARLLCQKGQCMISIAGAGWERRGWR